MLLTMNQMLSVAQKENFAVGAFNVSDSNLVRTVVEAAEECDAPAIVAMHFTELAYAKDDFLTYLLSRIKNSPVPFVIHLDHGDSCDNIMRAIHAGFSSVMFDGSALPFEENIARTKEIVDLCHTIGVSVEAELGTIGTTGTSVEGGMSEVIYTDPLDAQMFVEKTGCDSLAVAIGTCHGLYPKGVTPKLRMDVLTAITEHVAIPLVLHGGSGNPDSEIAEAIAIGIQKINISSDYKFAFFKKCREVLAATDLWDPNLIFPDCIVEGKRVIKQKMELFSSIGKASLYRQAAITQWRQAES